MFGKGYVAPAGPRGEDGSRGPDGVVAPEILRAEALERKTAQDMKNTTAPLIVYEDGFRKEIGTALVHFDPYGNVALVASISDTDYHEYVTDGLKAVALFTTKE